MEADLVSVVFHPHIRRSAVSEQKDHHRRHSVQLFFPEFLFAFHTFSYHGPVSGRGIFVPSAGVPEQEGKSAKTGVSTGLTVYMKTVSLTS